MRKFGRSENDYLDLFRDISLSRVEFLTGDEDERKIFEAIMNSDGWVDMSGKSDPPPDYYHDGYRLMMDVMLISDTEVSVNDKPYNVGLKAEGDCFSELKRSGLGHVLPGVVFMSVSVAGSRSYLRYRNMFERVVGHHASQIFDIYQKNHPGFQTVFFLFDDTDMYCLDGLPITHVCFYDKAFLEFLVDKGIDYVVWYAPYKFNQGSALNCNGDEPPLAVVIKVANLLSGCSKVCDYKGHCVACYDIRMAAMEDYECLWNGARWFYNMSVKPKIFVSGVYGPFSEYACQTLSLCRILSDSQLDCLSRFNFTFIVGACELLDRGANQVDFMTSVKRFNLGFDLGQCWV